MLCGSEKPGFPTAFFSPGFGSPTVFPFQGVWNVEMSSFVYEKECEIYRERSKEEVKVQLVHACLGIFYGFIFLGLV